jgi:hypothetical protein
MSYGYFHEPVESLNESKKAEASQYVVTDVRAVPETMKQDSDWLVVLSHSDSDRGISPIAPHGERVWVDDSRDLLNFEAAYEKAIEMVYIPGVNTDSGDRVALTYRFSGEDRYSGIDLDDVRDPGAVEEIIETNTDITSSEKSRYSVFTGDAVRRSKIGKSSQE